jgi:hypothetical protein
LWCCRSGGSRSVRSPDSTAADATAKTTNGIRKPAKPSSTSR